MERSCFLDFVVELASCRWLNVRPRGILGWVEEGRMDGIDDHDGGIWIQDVQEYSLL